MTKEQFRIHCMYQNLHAAQLQFLIDSIHRNESPDQSTKICEKIDEIEESVKKELS